MIVLQFQIIYTKLNPVLVATTRHHTCRPIVPFLTVDDTVGALALEIFPDEQVASCILKDLRIVLIGKAPVHGASIQRTRRVQRR